MKSQPAIIIQTAKAQRKKAAIKLPNTKEAG
jgi:hypothetical protein